MGKPSRSKCSKSKDKLLRQLRVQVEEAFEVRRNLSPGGGKEEVLQANKNWLDAARALAKIEQEN